MEQPTARRAATWSSGWIAAIALLLVAGFGIAREQAERTGVPDTSVLRPENLVAWCIVPFDAAKRSPAERAMMLDDLGIKRCAYDWRAEHVPTFEAEILEYKKHGIEFFAFWDIHDEALRLFEKYDLHPQIWKMIPGVGEGSQEERVRAAVAAMTPLAARTKAAGCALGLYNHGGWQGEPENLVAVCQALRAAGHEHVGIVYNFHHAHDRIADWPRALELMKPYLLCLNLNGMNDGAQPKILGIAQGQHELDMIREIVKSGYAGPIGVIDHREHLDAKESLQENLRGLAWVRKEIEAPGSGGPRPVPVVPSPPKTAEGSAKKALNGGRILPGQDAFREYPLTVQVRATLPNAESYNILVASDEKQSTSHWELFTPPGSGVLTAYLPGCQPDHVVASQAVCDGHPHTLSMVLEAARVRLYVDGRQVADQRVTRKPPRVVPGQFAVGRIVEGGLECAGSIDWVSVSRSANDLSGESLLAPQRSDNTLGLWDFTAARPAEPLPNTTSSHGSGHGFGSPVPAAAPPYDPALTKQLVERAIAEGDAARGAKIFAAAKTACLSCHRVGEVGGQVGPELTATLRERRPDQIVEGLLWPKREVRPEYKAINVVTVEGRVLSGYRVSGDDKAFELREAATGVVHRLSEDDVDEVVEVGTLMPEGLVASLSPSQQADLIRFLDSLRTAQPNDIANLSASLKQAMQHGPAEFPYSKSPLIAANWTNATHRVNRDRLYDYYTKEADFFVRQNPRPAIVPEFPGLDGGVDGHWGNQNEQSWADDRWNQAILGSVQMGVFRGPGGAVTRGVCVQLGQPGELSACFNIDTLSYDAIWTGGFVTFSSVRHGFMHGLQMAGTPVKVADDLSKGHAGKYRGLLRRGQEVAFRFSSGDAEYLDVPRLANGALTREIVPVASEAGEAWLKGGPTRETDVLETAITPGSRATYAVDTIELPFNNPWKALLFCGGHDFLADGSALVATMQGDVWRVTGLEADPTKPAVARWRRFATGLHHPLGLVVHEGEIFVQCRDQLVQLIDRNGDYEADEYRCHSMAFVTSPAGHDFICGLERDAEGRFYTASGNQGLIRISADGRSVEVLATGFRNPDGLGLTGDGYVTVPCSEGEWTPASMICAVPTNRQNPAGKIPFYGYGGPRDNQPPELPLAYLPRGLDNSAGGQVRVTSRQWGPLEGKMVHLSFGQGSHFLLLRDEVGGQPQGAIVPLPGDFRSGVHRGRFHPQDGQLYVSGMAGWGTYTPDDGCFQRVRYTGSPVQLPVDFHVHQNGVLLRFSEPLDHTTATNAANHFAQCWNYRYSVAYGSPEYAPSHPGVKGHDVLEIASSTVLDDGRSLFLEIPDLQPVNQLHVRVKTNGEESKELFITVHALDEPFTAIPDYRPVAKTIAAHPLLVDLATAAKLVPNPWRKKQPGARPLEVVTGSNLTYQTRELRAKAGEMLAITLLNPDVVPHNWALVAPGSLQRVGELSNRLIADPEAVSRHYIPATEDVLNYIDVVPPGERFTIYVRAPEVPGRYPYLCTFPGHWMVMNGQMIVEPR